jgi:hypothetical protein
MQGGTDAPERDADSIEEEDEEEGGGLDMQALLLEGKWDQYFGKATIPTLVVGVLLAMLCVGCIARRMNRDHAATTKAKKSSGPKLVELGGLQSNTGTGQNPMHTREELQKGEELQKERQPSLGKQTALGADGEGTRPTAAVQTDEKSSTRTGGAGRKVGKGADQKAEKSSLQSLDVQMSLGMELGTQQDTSNPLHDLGTGAGAGKSNASSGDGTNPMHAPSGSRDAAEEGGAVAQNSRAVVDI